MLNISIESNMARFLNYIASDCPCDRCTTYRHISEPFLTTKYSNSTEGNIKDDYTKSDQS
jgi:hypothetical protein